MTIPSETLVEKVARLIEPVAFEYNPNSIASLKLRVNARKKAIEVIELIKGAKK